MASDIKIFSRNLKIYIAGLFLMACCLFFNGTVLATTATSTASTTITANLSQVLYLANTNCNSSCSLNLTPSASGSYCTNYDTLNYYTNDGSGYFLYINDASSTSSALINGAKTIPSTSTVSAGGTASALSSANTWGYSAFPNPSTQSASGVNFGGNSSTNFPNGVTLGSITSLLETTATTGTSQCNASSLTGSPTFAGMPVSTSPQVIGYNASNITSTYSTVFYGLYANTGVPAGAYTTQIIYTLVSQ